MNWTYFTGFLTPRYRAELAGRISAWIDPPEQAWDEEPLADYRWSIEDNSCGKTLDYGYAEDLDGAKVAAEAAAKKLELA
jgi:hypothetical protein